MLERSDILALAQAADLRPGRSHRYGMCTHAGRRVFIKACVDERRIPRLRNEWEQLCWLSAARPGLVPEPLGYEEHLGDLVGVLVTGAVGQPARRLAESLRALHSIPCVGRPIGLDGQHWPDWPSFLVGSISSYIAGIRSHGGVVEHAVETEVTDLGARFARRYASVPLALVHGDPTFENLVLDGDGNGRLVDFELSHAGDPLFDIATAKLLCMDEQPELWRVFVEAYGLRDDLESRTRVWFYQVFRRLRLARGKVWIHAQADGCRRAMQGVEQLLAHHTDAEVDLG